MIHLLNDKKGNFYWLSVVKKGKSYEENGSSTEMFTQKHNCEKSIKNEAEQFGGNGADVIDHTGRVPVYFSFDKVAGKYEKSKKFKVTAEEFHMSVKEVDWVKNRK